MTKDVHALYNTAVDFIAKARQGLEKGEEVDLGGLDNMVAELCTFVTTLPEDEAAPYTTKLKVLMDDLNVISELLVKQQQNIRAQLDSLQQKRQAMHAYATADTLKDPKSDEA